MSNAYETISLAIQKLIVSTITENNINYKLSKMTLLKKK